MNQFDLFEQWLPINGCDGYFISTIGNVNEETLKEYIENQG